MGYNNKIHYSKWSSDVEVFKTFLDGVKPCGGSGHESI